jgi:tRNA (mo5U34)-methyltransferase
MGAYVSPDVQSRIDAINWYHEFDFGNGLVATAKTPDTKYHRQHWDFIRSKLDCIDFAGKTVLDIGCWDGYWSFYAEKRGAAHVLATDDAAQNWAGDSGLRLAKELLNSSVKINTNLSVYRLTELKMKFDIILCLGVYYHLIDPFYGFAQIRHCCHENTIVVFEGDVALSLPIGTGVYNLRDSNRARFQPATNLLSGFLEAAYFMIESETFLLSPRFGTSRPVNWIRRAIRGISLNRVMLVCRPFYGENECFWYPPPFGLDHYDARWK